MMPLLRWGMGWGGLALLRLQPLSWQHAPLVSPHMLQLVSLWLGLGLGLRCQRLFST